MPTPVDCATIRGKFPTLTKNILIMEICLFLGHFPVGIQFLCSAIHVMALPIEPLSSIAYYGSGTCDDFIRIVEPNVFFMHEIPCNS